MLHLFHYAVDFLTLNLSQKTDMISEFRVVVLFSFQLFSRTGRMVLYVAKNMYDVSRLHKTCFMLPWECYILTKAA